MQSSPSQAGRAVAVVAAADARGDAAGFTYRLMTIAAVLLVLGSLWVF